MLGSHIFEKLLANGPTHAVQHDKQHTVARSAYLGDDTFQYVFHAQEMIRRGAGRSPVGEFLGEQAVELFPAFGNGFVKLLVCLR